LGKQNLEEQQEEMHKKFSNQNDQMSKQQIQIKTLEKQVRELLQNNGKDQEIERLRGKCRFL